MSYSEAVDRARRLWGTGAIVWRSYCGLHVVGRTIPVGILNDEEDVEFSARAIQVLGEGESWEAAFAAVVIP